MISSNSICRLRIKSRGRLIEERDLRVLHQNFGDTEPLSHTVRKGRYVLVGDVRESGMGE